MTHPQSLREFEDRYNANYKVEGWAFQSNVHLPCPFCAAPDWLTYQIANMVLATQEGATCKECGRTAKMVLSDDGYMRMTQIDGPPPPSWYSLASWAIS